MEIRSLEPMMKHLFKEDDLTTNFRYINSLPKSLVRCQLKFKSKTVIAGLPYFTAAFEFLGEKRDWSELLKWEGTILDSNLPKIYEFNLPFHVALTGERIALNLLQRACAVASATKRLVDLAEPHGMQILDTRKTTPGLRHLEKYAVTRGGGNNHRYGQTDVWMIKDNHKSFFGGIENAVKHFKELKGFYTPIILEVHDLKEIEEGKKLGIRHMLLDNFSPDDIKRAISLKAEGMTYEVSGGITEENIEGYLIKGVDAFSVGAITYGAAPVDISLKYERVSHEKL